MKDRALQLVLTETMAGSSPQSSGQVNLWKDILVAFCPRPILRRWPRQLTISAVEAKVIAIENTVLAGQRAYRR
jgi:hypothetical protein